MIKMLGVLTYHAAIERKERFDFIREHFGFTNVVMEGMRDGKIYAITSSGVLLVKTLDGAIITAYPVSIKVATFISRDMLGKRQVPPKLYKKILKNMDRYPECFERGF